MTEEHFQEDMAKLLDAIEPEELSDAERESLILLREEEKLARDVYQTLYSMWNLPVFQNISESEQQHMNAVGNLLERIDENYAPRFISEEYYRQILLKNQENVLIEVPEYSFYQELTVG